MPKQMSDGRYFINLGYTSPASRSQPKFMLGHDRVEAARREAALLTLWDQIKTWHESKGTSPHWGGQALVKARRIASGEWQAEKEAEQDRVQEVLRGMDEGFAQLGADLVRQFGKPRSTGVKVYAALDQYLAELAADPTYVGTDWGKRKRYQVAYLKQALPDSDLADLDTPALDKAVAYIAARPPSRTKHARKQAEPPPISRKFARGVIKELRAWVRWLHKSRLPWRRPDDYEVVPVRFKRSEADRLKRRGSEQVTTYDLSELRLLWQYATPFERLLMDLGLNCGFNSAEISSLHNSEVLLWQRHPKAVRINRLTTDRDCWIMRERRKTEVYGEWQLWETTVQAIQWAQARQKGRANDYLVQTDRGTTVTEIQIRNAWQRLIRRVQKDYSEFTWKSFGKLRKTGANLIRAEAGAEAASLYLAHGEPSDDPELEDYTNKPWRTLHAALGQVGGLLAREVFSSVQEPFPPHTRKGGPNISPGTIQRIYELLDAGKRIGEVADETGLSRETIRRWRDRRQAQSAES